MDGGKPRAWGSVDQARGSRGIVVDAGWTALQYDYETILGQNFEFYNAERLGKLPADNRIPWRGDSLLYEIGPRSLGFGNVTGGWMGGGNAGTIKNTIPTAMSVAMLAWGMLEFPVVSSTFG